MHKPSNPQVYNTSELCVRTPERNAMVHRIYTNVSTSDGRYRIYRGGEVNPKTVPRKYDTQCPYLSTYAQATGERLRAGGPVLIATEPLMTVANYSSLDTNRLHAKLVEMISRGEQGDLLTSAVEWRSSLDMITSRGNQILQSYLDIRRGNFGRAASRLGIVKHRRKSIEKRLKKMRRLSPSEIWLEYWMGWAPMFGDIYNALDVLGRDHPPHHFTVGVTVKSTWTAEVGNKSTDYYHQSVCKMTGRISAYGDARVTNHNLRVADQLGLVNPARVAWNVVPFSFAIDWMLNVGQVLGSLTDFAGVSLSHTGQARKLERYATKTGWYRVYDYTLNKYVRQYVHVYGNQTERARTPGALPTPRLAVRFNRQSLTQAATSISLLNEIFLKK